MLRIGVTGGIGSGKSAVADCFRALGVSVIDADDIAREVVAPGGEAYKQVVAAFGTGILEPDGRIARARLGAAVFGNPERRRRLESIIHPPVRAELEARAARTPGPYVVLVIPLLIEVGQQDMVDRILVVDAAEVLRFARVNARDGRSEAEVRAIMAAQASRADRLAAAHDWIDNEGAVDTLRDQVARLDAYYRYLAAPGG
jgi:dephospho-CoA kinase